MCFFVYNPAKYLTFNQLSDKQYFFSKKPLFVSCLFTKKHYFYKKYML